jgi:hypothetical protein
MIEAVGQPPEMVEQMKASPAWGYLEAMAHTLAYDGAALGGDDQTVPTELLGGLTVPVLAVSSTGTAPWLVGSAEAVARAVPGARHVSLDGGFHEVPPAVLTPALTAFYTGRG